MKKPPKNTRIKNGINGLKTELKLHIAMSPRHRRIELEAIIDDLSEEELLDGIRFINELNSSGVEHRIVFLNSDSKEFGIRTEVGVSFMK